MLMRATIVLLLLLNLATAAWWLLHAPLPGAGAPAAPVGAARLSLVGEAGVAAAPAAPVPARQPPPAARTRVAPPPALAQPQPQPVAQEPVAPATAAIACEGGTGPADGWRVYLPRSPTADAARATAKRIAESGFSDYLVVVDGADANTIALGRYGTGDAAQRRVASLRAAGFPARCARIPKATPA